METRNAVIIEVVAEIRVVIDYSVPSIDLLNNSRLIGECGDEMILQILEESEPMFIDRPALEFAIVRVKHLGSGEQRDPDISAAIRSEGFSDATLYELLMVAVACPWLPCQPIDEPRRLIVLGTQVSEFGEMGYPELSWLPDEADDRRKSRCLSSTTVEGVLDPERGSEYGYHYILVARR